MDCCKPGGWNLSSTMRVSQLTNTPWTKCHVLVCMFVCFLALLFVIALNALMMAINNPASPPSDTICIVDTFQNICLGIFALELLVKFFVFGLVLHPRAFLRSSFWNCLDAFIIVLACIGFFIRSVHLIWMERSRFYPDCF